MGLATDDAKTRFRRAANRVYLGEAGAVDGKIGTQAERRLHAIIKYYLSDDPAYHEVKIGRMWADVMRDNAVFEIQTRGLSRLKRKLDAFLPQYDVTVVYPAAQEKEIVWRDPATGEVSEVRKSPKHETVFDALSELISLRAYLGDPHFHFRILFLSVQEFRTFSKYGKRHAPREERIPTGLFGEMCFEGKWDYLGLLPEDLPEPFSLAELARSLGIPKEKANGYLYLLRETGLVARAGKRGNALLWQKEENI